jgi:phospholipase C
MKKSVGKILIVLSFMASLMTGVDEAHAQAKKQDPSPINHFVFIIQENRSFAILETSWPETCITTGQRQYKV